jgi:hypothetical protein
MELGAIFGTGAMREHPRDALLWEGRVEIGGFPYLVRSTLRTDRAGTYHELRFYIAPRDVAPVAPQ